MTFAAAETRSFERAGLVMRNVGDQPVSAKTIERVVHDVGWELAERRDADPKTADALAQRPEGPPDLAVVECDGGRIRTREPGHGPGVHRTGEGWRETKNACLIRAQRKTFDHDPQPDPPECFCDPKHVAKIAETEALSVASPRPASSAEVTVDEILDTASPLDAADWRPKRLVRTVLSSLAASNADFRGGVTCLIDTQVARMNACMKTAVWSDAADLNLSGLKITPDTPIDLLTTAPAASARSRPATFNADFRGAVNCLTDTQLFRQSRQVERPPRSVAAGFGPQEGFKGTQYAPIDPPATARVLSALSTQPPLTGGCGPVCSDGR